MVPNRKEPRSRADQSRRKSVIHQKAHFFFLYSIDSSNPVTGSVIRPRQLLYSHLQISSLRCRFFPTISFLPSLPPLGYPLVPDSTLSLIIIIPWETNFLSFSETHAMMSMSV